MPINLSLINWFPDAVKEADLAGRPRKDSSHVTVESIVEAAWRVVDRDGLDALSTRALAAELNVKSPALYWHIRSKQQLLSLMVEDMLDKAIAAPPADLDWKERIRAMVRAQRRTFLAHRDSGKILSIAPPSERLRTEIFPRFIAPLLPTGLSESEAVAAGGFLAGFLLGRVIYEQHDETRAFMATASDPEAAFEFGLEAFIAGIEVMANRARG